MSGPRPLPAVELRPAWEFTCDECGRDSFVRAQLIAPESLDPEDRAMLDADGLPGDYIAQPGEVACLHCGAGFVVADGDGEIDDEGPLR